MKLNPSNTLLSKGLELPIMDQFYTIQGEGYHKGTAAFFIRVGGCDIGCHWCDVNESWDYQSHNIKSIDEIIFEAVKYSKLAVITGGEPLLQFKALEPFIELLQQQLGFKPFIEIETNGTLTPKGQLFNYIDLINCSPKLSNSGEPENKRIKINTI